MQNESTVPYYFRVAETLRGRIKARLYEADKIMPSEKELEEEFGVSNITIRKALDLLVKDGLVIRKRGIGTRVVRKENEPLAIKLTGNFREWFDSVSGKDPKLDLEILEIVEIPDHERIKRMLSIPSGENIWRMKRVRKFKGEPISYYINYAPVYLFRDVKRNVFGKRSLYEVLEDFRGPISKIEQRVEATTADIDVSSILNVPFGHPLFFGENIYWDHNGQALEVTNMYYRGDRYVYEATIFPDQAK
jgi:GntR family transcriptional regulator